MYDEKQIKPFTSPLISNPIYEKKGRGLCEEKKICSLILAGGDGSRLGSTKPKGCFPISPCKTKSLFELHAEKIVSLQQSTSSHIPLYILTSENNHDQTTEFFKRHGNFLLDVTFIKQPMLPLLTKEKETFLKNPKELALGPNGNGGVFEALTPHLEALCQYNYMCIINVDNPLAHPCDPELVGALAENNGDIIVRCFKHAHKNVGVLSLSNEKLVITDYTELASGKVFPYANTNIFCFSMQLIKKLCMEIDLPVHWITKKGPFYDPNSKETKEIEFYKREKFITDVLAYATKPLALDSSPDVCFAPLKTLEDLSYVHKALQNTNALLDDTLWR